MAGKLKKYLCNQSYWLTVDPDKVRENSPKEQPQSAIINMPGGLRISWRSMKDSAHR